MTETDTTYYDTLDASPSQFWSTLLVLGIVCVVGVWAAHEMDMQGHHITGMSNQIIWGLPHVFAVFLILCASGVLNVASLATVFGRMEYKPYARLSNALAVATLVGGLFILVLDLGRPDRLGVALTHYNFTSIFTWNVFLYTGFIAIAGVYLWLLMEPRFNRHTSKIGHVALVWRVLLTSGTGSIFGFLVARPGFDSSLMAPMFVAMSLSFGTALFTIVLSLTYKAKSSAHYETLNQRIAKLQIWFIAAVLYFTIVLRVSGAYASKHTDYERFLLLDGGPYTVSFWLGHIILGSLYPLYILGRKHLRNDRTWLRVACTCILLGAFCHLYTIIVGGQAFAMPLLAGKRVITDAYFDGASTYIPSGWEWLLGFGGVSLMMIAALVLLRVLRLLPRLNESTRPLSATQQ